MSRPAEEHHWWRMGNAYWRYALRLFRLDRFVCPQGYVDRRSRNHTLLVYVSLQQRRYAFSAEYKVKDWTVRSEYVHSTGNAFAKALSNTDASAATDCNLSADGDKAQGVYALVIAPIIPKKLHAKHVTICISHLMVLKSSVHNTT